MTTTVYYTIDCAILLSMINIVFLHARPRTRLYVINHFAASHSVGNAKHDVYARRRTIGVRRWLTCFLGSFASNSLRSFRGCFVDSSRVINFANGNAQDDRVRADDRTYAIRFFRLCYVTYRAIFLFFFCPPFYSKIERCSNERKARYGRKPDEYEN